MVADGRSRALIVGGSFASYIHADGNSSIVWRGGYNETVRVRDFGRM
jgi:hypothetical protein